MTSHSGLELEGFLYYLIQISFRGRFVYRVGFEQGLVWWTSNSKKRTTGKHISKIKYVIPTDPLFPTASVIP